MNTEGLKKTTNLKQLGKTLVLTGMLLLCGVSAKAQAVIMYNGYYLTHNAAGTSVNTAATNSFNPETCLWVFAQDDYIRTANSSGTAINVNNNYLQYTGITLGADGFNWYRARNNNAVRHRTGNIITTNYYLRLNGTTWQINTTNSNNGTLYNATITPYDLSDNLNLTISADGISGNTIYLAHSDLEGTFTPAYTRYQFNGTNHYWYDNEDHNTAPTPINANTLTPTYTWSVVSGDATINPTTGALTLNQTVSGNITVRLTVSDISPLNNRYFDYTITRSSVPGSNSSTTEISGLNIIPRNATLDVNQSQTFTATATATTYTVNTPAHITLLCPNGSGSTQYYYLSGPDGSNLYTSTDDFSDFDDDGHPAVTFSWNLSSEATNYMDLYQQTPGTTATVSYTTQAPSAIVATLTVTATASDENSGTITETLTAIVKGYAPLVAPTITAHGSRVNINTPSLDAEIWYTVDDGDPSDPNNADRIKYAGPFTVEGSPVTVKAVSYRNGNYSSVVTETVTLTLTPPVISFEPSSDGTTANTTIIGHHEGIAIHYTTDGTEPTASSPTYTDHFTVPSGTTVKAFVAKTGWHDSETVQETYTATKLETPFIEFSVLGVRFHSSDEEVTYYYTTNGSNPTTSSSSWHAGDTPIHGLADGTTIKVMAVKPGFLTSDIATGTYEELTHYVFMYSRNGVYHFLGNDNGEPFDCLYFNSSEIVWEGDPTSTVTDTWTVVPKNQGFSMHLCSDGGSSGELHFSNEPSTHVLTITKNTDTPLGTLIYESANPYTNYALQFGDYEWISTPPTGDLVPAKVVHKVTGTDGDNYAVRVASITPSVDHGGLAVLYPPTDGNPDDDEYMTIVGQVLGDNPSYLPDYFTVGFEYNHVGYFIEGGNTLLTEIPATATSFTYSYEFVDEVSEWCTIETIEDNGVRKGVVKYVKDPGHNMVIHVRVIASPVGYSNVTREAIATFTIVSDPPLEHPVITHIGMSNLYEMTTTAENAIIQYNLDGGDWFQYYGPIEVVAAGTVINARSYRPSDNQTSEVVSLVATGALIAPVITADNSGTVTITNPNSFAPTSTVYYTTDGTNPDESSTPYTAPFQANNETTIKAIVIANHYNDSPIAIKDVIFSGVTTTTVTLFDYEDHNWTYYSGVDASIDNGNYNTNYLGKLYSPNPRNVKITYNGVNGISGSTTAVKVSVETGETQNQFVYYKTLEQGSTTGEYPYQVISNPFSVRPSTGTGNSKVYYGFAGWKIVSGGEYIKNHNNDDVLALEEEIVFNNLPYTEVNCTSAEIVFQTTWKVANRTYVSSNPNNNQTYNTSGDYESNFYVINCDYTRTITTTGPVTIMMVEPDGSTDYRNNYTFTGNITPNNNGVTKIEYTVWNSTNTLNCNNHSVTVGRGMTTTSQCASYVTGVTGSASNNQATTYNTNLNFHLKLESGTFTDVSFIAGTEGTAGYVNCNGTSNQIKGTLGNDYDRAKNDNTKLDIVDELFLGYRPTYANGNQNNANFTCWVKSGNLCSSKAVTNTTFNNSGAPNGGYYGDANQVFYVSSGGVQTNIGKRTVYVEGGILSGIAGGIDSNNGANNESFILRMTGGRIRGIVYGSGAFAASSGIRRFIITGGTINGWIAAGCNGTDPTQSGGTLPSDTYVYVGGTTHVGNATDLTLNTSSDGNIFGAGSGNSAQATTGQVNNSNVVIADNCYVKNNVYGGGNYGYSNATATVYVTGGEVNGSVFGGSNQKQGVNVNVNMTGGQVNTGIYGGSNVTGTISGDVNMHINGGQVGVDNDHRANIHGGGFGSPTRVTGNVELTLGTTTQTTPGVTVYGDVYGGSALGYVNGTATSSYHTYVTMNKGLINGSLYGGGLGDASNPARVYGPVQVTVNGGSIKTTDGTGNNGSGAVFGCNNINGAPQQTVTVDIYGTDYPHPNEPFALFAVYGGGNHADYAGKPIVTIHGCDNSINYVYGGANAAEVNATDVTVWGGHIGYVFGGGNGTVEPANVTIDGTSLHIKGGNIENIFGGSNSQGSIAGDITVDIEAEGSCPLNLTNVFGGGNLAVIGSDTPGDTRNITTHIGCGVGPISELYGGSKQANIYGDVTLTVESGQIDYVFGGSQGTSATAADIDGNVTLNIYGGDIGSAFGGSNIKGNIEGKILVNIDWSQSSCEGTKQLENVYGASNLAQYEPTMSAATGSNHSPEVNLINGTVGRTVARPYHPALDPNNIGNQGNVFGGGKGITSNPNAGRVTANPIVKMNPSHNEDFMVLNAIYGGGEMAPVNGNTTVEISKGHVGSATKDIDEDNGFVFGGGKGDVINPLLAKVRDNSTVNISGGYVHNSVFGGGQIASVGDFTRATAADLANDIVLGEPYICKDGTGTTTVNISGGQVGPTDVTMLADLGYVFGASMGVYTQPKVDYTDPFFNSVEMARQNARFGYADNAVVTISGDAFIVGAVWGGSENGQVLHDCTVNILGGQIGCGKNKTAPYTNEQWAAAKAAVLSGNAAQVAAIAAQMPECDSWTYDGTHGYLPYDPYADDDGLTNASDPGYDGHTFFGNVFGGGSGYYGYRITEGSQPTRNVWFPFQGRVRGDTYLYITGGHILTSAYGGCEYATVLGKCTVEMSGGTLGLPRTAAQIQAHPVTCYLFGAGKGDQRTDFNEHTNVNETEVIVNGEAVIYGSVFGGGEDGHVVGDASVTIGGNALIGSVGTSYYDGNIFGGGRGFGGTSVLAGSIGGDATITIGDNSKILGSVFGGGRLASVGVYLVPDNDSNFGKLQPGKGNISVTINGGTIGNTFESNPSAFDASIAYAVDDFVAYENKLWRFVAAHPAGAWNASHVKEVTHTTGGNVFGGSMGRLLKIGESDPSVAANLNPIWPRMALCRSTDVNISGTTSVLSNVYGGGEMGLVFEDTDVTVEANTIVGHTIGSEHYGSVYGGGYGSDVLTPHTNDSTNVTAARHAGLVYGNAIVSVTGGQIKGNVFGGGEMATVGTYDYDNSTDTIQRLKKASTGQTTVTVTGGIVGVNSLNNGSVFGAGKGVVGANMDPYTFVDRTTVSISGDATEVRGCVFGSGDNGHVLHNTQVEITGGTIGNNNGSPTNGNVFGSGRGADTYLVGSTPTLSPNAGRVYGSTNVTIDGNNTTIKNNVYGGGYLATVDGNTTVTIGTDYDPTVYGDVFGGSALGAIGKASGTTTLNIFGGTIGSTSSYYYNASTGDHKGNIFGGGNGDAEGHMFDGATNGTTDGKRAADVRNTVVVTIGATDDNKVNTTSATITGDVFGGNNVMGTPLGNVTVDINSTKRTSGTNTIDDSGFALYAVYGGGNKADYVPTATNAKSQVNVNGCYNTVQYVYGGGNAAAVPEANSMIEGGHIQWAFAGGNGYSATGNHTDPSAPNYNPGANVGQLTGSSTTYGSGNATADIYGGTIDNTFAGSNQYGTIKGTTTVTLDNSGSTCDMNLNEVFGGGNEADIDGDVTTVIQCNPSMENVWIPALYGGCNMANVTGDVNLTVCGGSYLNIYGGSKGTSTTPANISGDVTLTIKGGRVGNSTTEGNIFGGSNINGSIGGQITVNVEHDETSSCLFDLSHANVYGGGDQAQYTGSPVVNIKHGTVLNVFGGGNGNPADALQNPGKVGGSTVTIGDDNTAHRAVVLRNVYGGGNAAKVTGNTSILLKQRAKVFGNVYGGGNMGKVEGNTDVIVNGVSGN